MVAILFAAPAAAVTLHVHQYVGHHHADHDHGPAAHEHRRRAESPHAHADAADADHHSPSMDQTDCNPGRHAVIVKSSYAPTLQVHLNASDAPRAITIVLPPAPCWLLRPVDVRVHGPPLAGSRSTRAPPLTHLA